jgi:hypothetical protein
MLQLGGGSRFTVSSRELIGGGGIYIYFISVLCTITAESSTTDLATTHLTSLARDIFWSQKSQLYIVNSYSWNNFFSDSRLFFRLAKWFKKTFSIFQGFIQTHGIASRVVERKGKEAATAG